MAKKEKEGTRLNFDPNDEFLLRGFVMPELIDALNAGELDTDKCMSKTEMIIRWSLGEHLEREGRLLTSAVFEGMIQLYDRMTKADIKEWWGYIPEDNRDENRKYLNDRKSAHSLNFNEWRFRRSENS